MPGWYLGSTGDIKGLKSPEMLKNLYRPFFRGNFLQDLVDIENLRGGHFVPDALVWERGWQKGEMGVK
jgi:hypothetical protein